MTDLRKALTVAGEMMGREPDSGAGYALAYGYLVGTIKARIDEDAARPTGRS